MLRARNSKQFGYGGIIGDESGTAVNHTEETSNFMSGSSGAVLLITSGEKPFLENIRPKNSMLHFAEFALWCIQGNVFKAQMVKNGIKLFVMRRLVFAKKL